MSLLGKSRLIPHKKARTLYLTIPASVANDSAFPFKAGQEITIQIEKDKIVLKRTKSG